MKRAILALLLLVATPTWAANEVTIQPDETFPWACEMWVALASVTSVTVTQLDATGGATDDATPATLVSGQQVNPSDASQVLFQLVPTGKADATTKRRVYQVHILAADADANKYACDGRVNVEVRELEW